MGISEGILVWITWPEEACELNGNAGVGIGFTRIRLLPMDVLYSDGNAKRKETAVLPGCKSVKVVWSHSL